MTKELKERLLHEARCADEVMRYLWRAYFAAKYDNAENCLGILDALRSTTGSQRWDKFIDEVRKETEK